MSIPLFLYRYEIDPGKEGLAVPMFIGTARLEGSGIHCGWGEVALQKILYSIIFSNAKIVACL